MDPRDANAMLRLGKRRFRSFSDAVELVLGTLTEILPGTVAFARREIDEQVHRVIEARGEAVGGLARGAVLQPAGESIDADALRALGAVDWISAPLELSNGQIVGMLCAADRNGDAYRPGHEATLAIAARLLSYEWESVELRSELRRGRSRESAGSGFDADTALPNRERFLELLDHEWRLAQRGAVQSVLVACRIHGGENGDEASGAKRTLALKIAAEVLEGSARATDRVGRIGPDTVGTVLVGCRLQDTPSFVARFLSALERVGGDRAEVKVSCGVQSLQDPSSPEEALGLAEAAAAESEPRGAQERVGTR